MTDDAELIVCIGVPSQNSKPKTIACLKQWGYLPVIAFAFEVAVVALADCYCWGFAAAVALA